MCAKMQSTVF